MFLTWVSIVSPNSPRYQLFWWNSLMSGSQARVSVWMCAVCVPKTTQLIPGGLSDRVVAGGCHMAHWNAPAMRARFIVLIGIIRKIVESVWLQRTWRFVSKLWRGEKAELFLKSIHINWHVKRFPQVTLIWEDRKHLSTFFRVEYQVLLLCYVLHGKFSLCVHIPNPCVLGRYTDTRMFH